MTLCYNICNTKSLAGRYTGSSAEWRSIWIFRKWLTVYPKLLA